MRMRSSDQQAFGVAVFEQQVRLTTTEIDAAVEVPGGIQQCISHDATSLVERALPTVNTRPVGLRDFQG